jgi:hypothetical protein
LTTSYGGGDCGIVAAIRQRGRPLLRDARRTPAWPVLATCVIVIATLGLLVREQAQPDGFDSVVGTTMIAAFRGTRASCLGPFCLGRSSLLMAVSIAVAVACLLAGRPNGVVLTLAFLKRTSISVLRRDCPRCATYRLE